MSPIDAITILLLPVAAFAVVYILAIIAFLLYRWTRDQRRDRTFSLIFSLGVTRADVAKAWRADDLVRLFKQEFVDDEEKKRYFNQLEQLNKFEVLAIGIREGFYDEKILFEYMNWTFVAAYRRHKPLIDAARHQSGNQSVFVNLEAIARRWEERKMDSPR